MGVKGIIHSILGSLEGRWDNKVTIVITINGNILITVCLLEVRNVFKTLLA